MKDVIIIGAGFAGLTAAIYAGRAGGSVLVFEKAMQGGQIVYAGETENYPAVPSASGFELASALYSQAANFGAEIISDEIIRCDFSDIKTVYTKEKIYTAKTVIIANGAVHRQLGCEGEKTFAGKGVSYCATCDGNFYKNKTVAIIGGGNSALSEALYLSNICETVHIFHRRDTFRGEKILADRVFLADNIIIHFGSKISKIAGSERVEAIIYNETETLPVSAVFVSIGMQPKNEMFSDFVLLNEEGYIKTNENCETKTQGIFAAGDTREKYLRQLVTAASDGAIAGARAMLI